MPTSLSFFVVLSEFLVSSAFAGDSLVGQTLPVPGFQWVDTQSAESSPCAIDEGGTVKVLSVQGADAVVEYQSQANGAGALCANRAPIKVKVKDLSTFRERSAAVAADRAATAGVVSQLLAGKPLNGPKTGLEGKVIHIPEGARVDVLNVTPLKQALPYSEPLSAAKKSSCSVETGGSVSVLGSQGPDAIVLYTAPGTGQTTCPSGTVFKVKSAELSNYESKYQQLLKARADEAAETKRILAGKSAQAASGIPIYSTYLSPYWKIVQVQLPASPDSKWSPFALKPGDSCGMEKGGTFMILGFKADQKSALVRYTPPHDIVGMPCPFDATFYLSTAEINTMSQIPSDQHTADMEKMYTVYHSVADSIASKLSSSSSAGSAE
jgi:hypothetical protein